MKQIWASIEKAEEQSDGTVIVSGYASAPSVDSDGEMVTAAAMAEALPDYMKFGAVREMHQPKAAGNALEAYVETDTGKTFFTAHVVDGDACKKVKNKVYKGFSIGGKVLERSTDDPNQITRIKLIEVSLVDRPANPDSVFTMYKAETSGESPVELQKSLWDVAELAATLGHLKSIQSSLAFDAAYDGQISEASMKLKQDINNLADTLISLIGEEVADLSVKAEGATKMTPDKKADDCEKPIADADKATTDESKAAGDMPAEGDAAAEDEKDEDKPAKGKGKKADDAEMMDDKSKKSDDIGDLSKMSGDTLSKVIGAAVTAAIDPLLKRITDLEAQPAPSKAHLKVVGKGQDIGGAPADEEAAPAGLSPEAAASWEIKKLHRAGGLL